MIFDQQEFDVRCEWGEHGVAILGPTSDVIIVVDVLSFCTCVDIAVGRGASVYPYARRDDTAQAYAASLGALLAAPWRTQTGYSLSPASLTTIPAGTRIVLPSPNGSALTLAAKPAPVLAGCLRNATAVASEAGKHGRRVGVVAAGERWKDDGSLRPAFEDLVGAGAIIHRLQGSRSPEASLAAAAFLAAEPALEASLRQCGSGKELIESGFEQDVVLAAQLDASDCAPVLVDGAYRHAGMPRTTRYQGAIIRDHHILLIKAHEHATGRRYWLIPGGGIEPGESEELCVQREMQEETGLHVEVQHLLLDETGIPGGLYRRLKTYLCRIVDGEAQPGYEPEVEFNSNFSITDVGWFDLRQPATWDDQVVQDGITYPLLQRIQVALGYAGSRD